MKLFSILLCFVAVLHSSYAPPVTPDKNKEQDSEIKDDLDEYMEYHRYLKEVVQALESDPDFRERLEKANDEDVRSGKIAEQLDFVNHNVRTKLDEIKRRELERLRHLATKQYELTNNLDMKDLEHNPRIATNEHLDHGNPHTFEIEDLKKLIKKTTSDLEVADKQRKEQFKEYEMQKEFEKHQKLEDLNEEEKKEFQKKIDDEDSAKKHHKPIHHPGSKQQLEEVWEKQDHMQDQQFDPKAFFMMHDVDGNGVWDADEVKALFVKELDKMYGPGGPNKDLHERAEEMERMREHVFTEADKNHDGLIDFNEFMQETQKADFNQDPGWQPIDENQIYTHDEYEKYEKARLQEIKYLQERGLVDAHGRPLPGAEHHLQGGLYPPGQHAPAPGFDHPSYQGQHPPQQLPHGQYPPQGAPQGQYPPQGHVPQGAPQGQYPPQGQVPQGVPQGQYPPQGVPQGQYPPQVQVAQGVPQGQYPPQGVPQGQYPPQGVPQGQYPPQGQVAQGVPQGQVLQGQYPPQGQVPQGQYPSQGQIPQGQQPLQGQGTAQGQVPLQGQAAVEGQIPPQGQSQHPAQASQGHETPKV